MKILIAPDKFKGTFSSIEIANIIKNSIFEFNSDLEIEICPLSDGGDGFIDVIHYHLSGSFVKMPVNNPLFRTIESSYLLSRDKKIAYIEMAKASGIELLEKHEQNPLYTTSYGTGEFIIDALQLGVEKIYLGVGGSATTDAGIGMATAVGWSFYDDYQKVIIPTGENLKRIAKIRKACFRTPEVIVAADVDNIFCGSEGAAYTFAPQKGANPEETEMLDIGLNNLATLLKIVYKKDIFELKGSGAAGGLAGGAFAFLNAKIKNGASLVFKLINFEEKLKNFDLIITGEGHLDQTSINGKLISKISELAQKHKKKMIVIAGKISSPERIKNKLKSTEILPLFNDKLPDIETIKKTTPELIKKQLSKILKKD